jgi:hypothetical protein
MKKNKKAKKSFCPRASTGNTHHGMRYVGSKLFSFVNIRKIIIISATCLVTLLGASVYLRVYLVIKSLIFNNSFAIMFKICPLHPGERKITR